VGARRPFADAVSHPPRIGLDALFETLDLVRHALAVFRYLTLDLIWFLAHCMSSLIESMVRCGLNEMRFSRKYAIPAAMRVSSRMMPVVMSAASQSARKVSNANITVTKAKRKRA